MAEQSQQDDDCTDTQTQTVEVRANVSRRPSMGKRSWDDVDVREQEIEIDRRYEPTRKACGDSQQDVADMWRNMKFPKYHVHYEGSAYDDEWLDDDFVGVLYSWSSGNSGFGRRMRRNSDPQVNYEARQLPDGSGRIVYYRTDVSIRYTDGTVIHNENCGSSGFGRCAVPEGGWLSIPLDNIETMIRESEHSERSEESRWSIADVIGKEERSNKVSKYRNRRRTDYRVGSHFVVVMENGTGYLVGRDNSVNRGQGQQRFGVRIPSDDMERVHTVSDALDIIKPFPVRAAERQGRDIKRQGEWWLVPEHPDFQPEGILKKCLPVANRKKDYELYNMSLGEYETLAEPPRECDDCGASSFDVDARNPLVECTECGKQYAYGDLTSDAWEDILRSMFPREMTWLDEANDDILDSHVPRDLMQDEGDILVRGTFRHVDNEHSMFTLGERWHRAYTHGYEAWTLDPRPWDTGGRGGGMD